MGGQLIIFEGPDGVGKTTLSERVADWLRSKGLRVRYVSFPGREQGALGKLVYDLHHSPEQFGCNDLDPTALQLLHVAAHIDALRRTIAPALAVGETVVLDRCWWSTIVYGMATSAHPESIRSMIKLERIHWAGYTPSVVFLLHRATLWKSKQSPDHYVRLQTGYAELARAEKNSYPVKRISTNEPADKTLLLILPVLQGILGLHKQKQVAHQGRLPFSGATLRTVAAPTTFSKLPSPVPSEVYDTYWRFAAERQHIFFQRLRGLAPPWTDDPVLRHFKFTNAYRASDRVSQYLIKNVIYGGPKDPQNIFFRTILFKLFNKIETWELLDRTFGSPICATFDIKAYDHVLTAAMQKKQKIYSAAYIMPSGGRHGEPKKHRNHLKLLSMMLADNVPARLMELKTMQDAFELLRSYPMIGDFLAYQYTTDLNYSDLTDFRETEFVVPGPGARDGIRKCFTDFGGLNEADIIKMIADRQNVEFETRGINFQSLWGRPLQLIDCQNLFCEVDKYARYAHPEITGITGRTRIKQIFRLTSSSIQYWYPPKWKLNELVRKEQEIEHASIRF